MVTVSAAHPDLGDRTLLWATEIILAWFSACIFSPSPQGSRIPNCQTFCGVAGYSKGPIVFLDDNSEAHKSPQAFSNQPLDQIAHPAAESPGFRAVQAQYHQLSTCNYNGVRWKATSTSEQRSTDGTCASGVEEDCTLLVSVHNDDQDAVDWKGVARGGLNGV